MYRNAKAIFLSMRKVLEVKGIMNLSLIAILFHGISQHWKGGFQRINPSFFRAANLSILSCGQRPGPENLRYSQPSFSLAPCQTHGTLFSASQRDLKRHISGFSFQGNMSNRE
jgi:hypothetical protein